MSDKMKPISFSKMVSWILKEYKEQETIFGIHKNKIYKNNSGTSVVMFGDKLSSPLGPAAGPNTQLTQNIIASYLTGSRFIELKTVQILDGEDLPVAKPCIACVDECYNVEWSTELRVQDAYNEYIKAWFLLHVLMKELNLSDQRDFMFNMSVGYDLEGIKSPKIDAFIEGMRHADKTEIWQECKSFLQSNLNLFKNFNEEDLNNISSTICPSITLSTLHGCPPEEIEKIARYLLEEKGLHTFVKMNPTLLGEEFVAKTLSQMGYEYMELNPHHFKNDLQYNDAIAMLKRLKALGKSLNLAMGVKLTNTLPVKIVNNELPGEEMYMSGRSLYPLTIHLASQLASEFDGDLLISYSGGADYFNVDKIFNTGIMPVTFATTILKPGGYERITQMARKVEKYLQGEFKGIDVNKIKELADASLEDKHHQKELRTTKSRKLDSELPLFDCAISPCTQGCPINQQIPEYVSLVGQKKYDEAFSVIIKDNAAPFITGSICPHTCQLKCTRLDYDESVSIRDMKKIAATNAESKYIESIEVKPLKSTKKVGIIGAGPAGLSAAYFLRRNGLDVTVMDKREKPYGTVQYVIPEFRISSDIIEKDFELVKKQGVQFKFGVDANFNLESLKKEYDYVILAIGATKPGTLRLSEGEDKAINAISFLEEFKANNGNVNLGKHVSIIGGGDVAMDAARAAKRVKGVESVSIVYRRTKTYMPASLEEIELALADGIILKELLSPVAIKDGKLECEKMTLGKRDEKGRRVPVSTGEKELIECDSVIVAVGEKVDSDRLQAIGIELDERKHPVINQAYETNLSNVYIAGDVKKGPATIVKAIADSKVVTKDILRKENMQADFDKVELVIDEKEIYNKKGTLSNPILNELEANRCLSCGHVCELCVDVCPNRANMMIKTDDGKHQVIHLDGMCNECGNCGVFCPHTGNPYKDKFTVFWTEEDFKDSTNRGFLVLDKEKGLCQVRTEDGNIVEYRLGTSNNISKDMAKVIENCFEHYGYIL